MIPGERPAQLMWHRRKEKVCNDFIGYTTTNMGDKQNKKKQKTKKQKKGRGRSGPVFLACCHVRTLFMSAHDGRLSEAEAAIAVQYTRAGIFVDYRSTVGREPLHLVLCVVGGSNIIHRTARPMSWLIKAESGEQSM